MSDASFENLISAYLDNELGPAERAQAERLIADDAEMASMLETMKAQSSELKSLPRYKLSRQFANRLKATPAFEEAFATATSGEQDASGSVTRPTAAYGMSKNWRAAAVAIGSLAALILITLIIDPSHVIDERVAQPELPAKKTSPAEPVDEAAGNRPAPMTPPKSFADKAGNASGREDDGPKGYSQVDKLKLAKKMGDGLFKSGPSKNSRSRRGAVQEESEESKETVAENDQMSGDRPAQILAISPVDKANIQYRDAVPFEQVINITLAAKSESEQHRFGDLNKALAENDIVLENVDIKLPVLNLNQLKQMGGQEIGPEDFEALYIVTSPAKMRGLISELAANNTTVSAYGFPDQDSANLSMELSKVTAAQNSQSNGIRNDPGKTISPPKPREPNPVEKFVPADKPAAPVIGSKMDSSTSREQAPAGNQYLEGQSGTDQDRMTDQALAGGQVFETEKSAESTRAQPKIPSFARRLNKKSELTIEKSTQELGQEPGQEPGKELFEDSKSVVGLDAGGGRGGLKSRDRTSSGFGATDADTRVDGIAQKRKGLRSRKNDVENRNIELINRFLGIQSDAEAKADDQTLRGYLLLVRRAERPADQGKAVAPSASEAQPNAADK